MDEPTPKKRAIYLGVEHMRLLDHWCASLRSTFGRTPYLCGSVLQRADWRDVDIRIQLTNKEMHHLPLNRLDLNMMLSEWGKRVTGLPIDCQVQSADAFHEHDGEPRNPRGWIDR